MIIFLYTSDVMDEGKNLKTCTGTTMLKLSAFLELQIYVIRQRHDNSFKRKFPSFVYNFDRHANKVL